MHPDAPNWKEELSRVERLGLKGVKLHPVYQGVDFDDPRFLRILDRCGELGLVVLTHAGLDVGFPGKVHASPEMILNALRQVGPVKLILAHMGGWRNWDQVEQLLPHTPVYLDTSFSLGDMNPAPDGFYRPEELHMMGRSSSPAWLACSARSASSSAPTAPGAARRRAWTASAPCPCPRIPWTRS
ncbi:MAG: amidohydrolase family protein [Lawsonibacter sp.]